MLAQITDAAKKAINIRVSFRVGRLEIKNGELSWKQFSEEVDQAKQTFLSENISQPSAVNSRYSRNRDWSRVGSHTKSRLQRLSVITPTYLESRVGSVAENPMARTETKTTKHSETFHLSNPNP